MRQTIYFSSLFLLMWCSTSAAFEIKKGRAESLTFSKCAKSFSIGGSFSTLDVVAGVVDTKGGYTLKEIKNLNPLGLVRVHGTKPHLSLGMIKAGSFRATIVLEHPAKADATITGTTFEMKSTWDKTFGGRKEDIAKSIVQTSDGGLAVAGYTYSKGVGSQDLWVLKLDAWGNKIWDKTFGGSGSDYANSIVQTSDGGLAIAGSTTSKGAGDSDFWVLKLDALGNKIWDKTFGASGEDTAESIVQTSDGGLAVAGATTSKGAGNYDFWVLRLDALGTMVWEQTFGGGENDGARSIVRTSDGGLAVAGATTSKGAGNYDFWVLRLDALGTMVWEQTFGSTENDGAYSIVQTSDGGLAVAGATTSKGVGNFDFWVLRLDALGTMVWEQTFGGSKPDGAYSIVQTSDGGLAVAGATTSKGAGDSDFWVLKLDALGTMVWEQTFGGGENDEAHSIVQTSDGGLAVAGTTYSKGAGDADFWVLKLDKHGKRKK